MPAEMPKLWKTIPEALRYEQEVTTAGPLAHHAWEHAGRTSCHPFLPSATAAVEIFRAQHLHSSRIRHQLGAFRAQQPVGSIPGTTRTHRFGGPRGPGTSGRQSAHHICIRSRLEAPALQEPGGSTPTHSHTHTHTHTHAQNLYSKTRVWRV